MKASELVVELQKAIDEYGDKPVIYYDECGSQPAEMVRTTCDGEEFCLQ